MDERSSVCGVGMARVATWARLSHRFSSLRERTSCRSGGIPSVETAHAREWVRKSSAQLVDHGQRLRNRDVASASERDWCEEAAPALQPTTRQTRKSLYRAFQDLQALHQGFGRTTGATRERLDLGFEPDCGKDCVLRSSGERDVQIEDCEENSPSRHRLDCYGNRRFDLHAPIWKSGYH